MAIVAPENLNFSNKNIIMILSGLPGRGKTTLALSAPDVLLIDADEGLARVKKEHRKDASICRTFEDVQADIQTAKGHYKTIAVDTTGALIEMIKDYVVRKPDIYPGGTQKNGSLSLKGYGYVSTIFLDFSNTLRKDFNVVYVFHEEMTKVGEDTFYSLICEGKTRSTVFMPADLAAHMEIINDQRYLGFTPTQNYTAKSAYGIKGLVPVPELADGDKNDFLTRLFKEVRKNLEAEAKERIPMDEASDENKAIAAEIIGCMNSAEDYAPMADSLKKLLEKVNAETPGTTFETEVNHMIKKRLDELGLKRTRAGEIKPKTDA